MTSSQLSIRFRPQLTGLLLSLLQNEQDLSTRRNAFQFLTAVDQPRAIKYLMSQVTALHHLVESIRQATEVALQYLPFVGSSVMFSNFLGIHLLTRFVW